MTKDHQQAASCSAKRTFIPMKRRKMVVLRWLSLISMLVLTSELVQVQVRCSEGENEMNQSSEDSRLRESDNKQQASRRLNKRQHERYGNLLASAQQQRRAQPTTQPQSPIEQPPGELTFSNNTGAVAQCGVALELAKSIARAEATSGGAAKDQQPQSRAASGLPNDIQVRWLKEGGDEVEQVLYAEPQQQQVDQTSGTLAHQQRPLRFVRTSDGALVFEPFRASDFRPDVHATVYRCVAWSSSRGASLVSRDMRVRAVLNLAAANQLEVLDELVLEGNSATFRCQMASFALDYLQVVDWIEYPGETVLSFQSTTLQHASNHLWPTTAHNVHRRTELLLNNSSATSGQMNRPQAAASRYFVAPKSGNLHVVNVDASLNYRQFRCRCKNKLTGELLSSVNKGKLVVTDANSPLAPRLSIEASAGMAPSAPLVYEEGELAMLVCDLQAFSRVQLTWSRVRGAGGNSAESVADSIEPIEMGASSASAAAGFAQVGNLLLINRAQRNHSGRYLCLAKNALGEERLEMELQVRAPLRAKLSASGHVLELGKSLALECSVTGFPIHQVVFRHNQNVIKSISGAAVTSAQQQQQQQPQSQHQQQQQQQQQQMASSNSGGSYFVVDSAPTGSEVAGSGELPSSGGQVEQAHSPADEQTNQIKLSHVIVIVLEPQHAGAYQCFAHNQYESVQSSAYIRVLDDPPKFKETFRSQVFEQRQDVSLQCAARANPLPEITWSVDEQPIGESARARFGDFVTKDNLVISYVNISQTQVADSGLYRCTADNGLAQLSHQAQISVMGPLQVKPMGRSTVLASTTFRIRCPVAGHPVAEVQWQHAGRRLPANHRQHVYENGTLEVEHMERSAGDDGEYTCLASSGQPGEPPAQGSIQVSIKARPTIEPFSISRSLREGQRASVMCTISSGDLPIAISWFRNEQPLVETSDGQVLALGSSSSTPQVSGTGASRWFDSSALDLGAAANQQHQQQHLSLNNGSLLANVRISRVSDYSSTLLFESLLVHHSANYTCLARNEAGSVSHQAHMVVQVAPRWTIEPSDTNVVRGASLSIDCMASGFPPPRVIWTKALAESSGSSAGSQRDKEARSHLGTWRSIVSSPHLQVHENGSLNVLDARDSDFGHYMCQAANGVGPGLSKVIKVTVNVAAQFNMRHSVQYVSRGEQTHLKCQTKGDWPVVVHWFKNKSRLEPMNGGAGSLADSGGHQLHQSTGETSLLQLAGSQAPASSALAHLQTQALRSGSSVMEQLNELLLSSSSPSQVQTTLGSQQQQPSKQMLLTRYSLSQSEVALNRADSTATGGSLVERRGATGGGVQQQQQQQLPAQPPLVVQVNSVLSIQQAERLDTSTFRCIAANHFGLDERLIQLVVQEPPERVDELSVLETSSRSIALAWLAPHDGNTPITHYHVHYRAASTSHAHSQETPEPAWLNLTLAAGDVQATLAAAAASSSSGLQSAKMNQMGQNPTSPAGRTLVKVAIGGLKPVTHYWFSVEAENKLGVGLRSPVLESRTVEEAPGAAPAKIKASAQSSSSIKVSWSRLQEKELFGPVQGYYVAYRPLSEPAASSGSTNNRSSSQQQDEQATSLLNHSSGAVLNTYKTVQHEEQLNKFEALLTGLRRSTRYMISVQAFNARGAGPSSEPIVERTLDMDPPRQVKLFVKQTSNCSIELEWRPLSQTALQPQQQQNKQQLVGATAGAVESKSSQLPTAMPFLIGDQQSLTISQLADQVDYYSLYQAELNERPQWQEIRIQGHASSHLLEQLRCGTRYRFYMMGVNRIGMGEQSEVLDTKTAGGLPIAPDRQSTFDVINTTCYVIRLDHWQDNGCPIREFYVRYRADSTRDWTQLAHLNLTELAELNSAALPTPPPDNQQVSAGGGGGFKSARLASAQNNQLFRTSSSSSLPSSSRLSSDLDHHLWPTFRVRRSIIDSDRGKLDDDTYVFNGDTRDEEDSFFDYLPADGSLASGDLTDYAAESFNLSAEPAARPEQSSQLFNLLKDSMLPAFEADELEQPRLERLPTPAQEWQPSDFAESSPAEPISARSVAGRIPEQQQQQQQQHQHLEPSGSRTAHATRLPSSPQDWRRVRLCNLLENAYYTIQVTAANSVGETDAELRLLTSQEGLEYDQEVKRQVVGKLGGDRMAQHSLAIGDSFNLLAPLNHWPLLLPVTLLAALMTVVLVVLLLLNRGSTSAPGSTSTTTTTSSSSSNHCQNYLNGTLMNQHHRAGGGGGGESDYRAGAPIHSLGGGEMGTSVAGESFTMANQGLIEAGSYANNPNLAIYQQHRSDQSVFEEPPYGVVGVAHMGAGTSASTSTGNGMSNDLANRSSSSPATTAIGSSLNSGSSSNGGQYFGNVFAATSGQQQHQDSLARAARNAYLCKEEAAVGGKPEAIFYAITNPQQAAHSIYASQQTAVPQTVQLRHYQQHPDDAREIVNNSVKESASYLTTSNKQVPIFQPNDLYGVGNQHQLETGEGGKLDNCFLNIVEEVARANESLSQQRLLQQNNAANKTSDSSTTEHEVVGAAAQQQCNQDCYNHLMQTTSNVNYSPTNAAGGELLKEPHGDNQMAGRLMFDPVYATIRRTFPQAFKYLTLQQHHSQQHQAMLRSSPLNQQLICNQRNLNEESIQDQLDRYQLQQQRQQSSGNLVNHNMSIFNTDNLAALNLLTPTTDHLQQQQSNTESSQQQ